MNINPISEVYLMDCVQGMKEYPDKFFDLAICDPPYGIDILNKSKSFSGKKAKYEQKEWDNEIPNIEYFMELFRVSKNQIIWGANYFLDFLPSTKCIIFWDKCNTNKGKFADGEMAWTSFNQPTCFVSLAWLGYFQPNMKNKQIRIHPTQKPLELYSYIIEKFANKGDKILDTHLGSGSSRIAAQKLGFDFYGFEIDADYFEASEKRFKNAISMPLFDVPFVPQQLVLV